ncbi:hypothetical protein HanIR_Chr02g0067791 [Helianthus annuus]|nr:hypothetical protein HanIR_Chr02g0067791 [Helianthus annuus]
MQKFVSKKLEGVTTVLILQTGKFTFSGGKAYVSSTFHGSILFINDDIEEIIAFKHRFDMFFDIKESDNSVSSRRLVSSQSVISLQDEFLSKTPFNNIEEVNKTAMMSAIVTGTLISFLPGFEWYYNACKACNNKVTTAYVITDPVDGVDGSKMVEQKKIIQCPGASCNKKVIVIVSRYKIPLRLQDNTSVVSLIVLDREAKKMLKKRQRFA